MQLHLYLSQHAASREQLKKVLKGNLERFNVIQYTALENIGRVLPSNGARPDAAVILLGNKAELLELLENKFIRNLKSILIFPETDPETMQRAYALSPITICHSDSDFEDVASILEHIQTHIGATHTYAPN